MAKARKKLDIATAQRFIQDQDKYIFSPLDLERFFKVTNNTARHFIHRHLKKGVYQKIKPGLYFDRSLRPGEIKIANELYRPSYISFEYALSLYHIIPETVYAVTSAAAKTTREFNVQNIMYYYYHLKKSTFTGYTRRYLNNQIGYVAEPEKALADWLYYVDLGRRSVNDRLDVSKINYKKLREYARLFERPSLLKLVKQIYDQSRNSEPVIY